MMKLKCADPDGRTVVLLGLSHRNLDRLRADGLSGFIKVVGEDLEIGKIDIFITAAATEEEMLRSFEAGIREGTKVRIDPRLKS